MQTIYTIPSTSVKGTGKLWYVLIMRTGCGGIIGFFVICRAVRPNGSCGVDDASMRCGIICPILAQDGERIVIAGRVGRLDRHDGMTCLQFLLVEVCIALR